MCEDTQLGIVVLQRANKLHEQGLATHQAPSFIRLATRFTFPWTEYVTITSNRSCCVTSFGHEMILTTVGSVGVVVAGVVVGSVGDTVVGF